MHARLVQVAVLLALLAAFAALAAAAAGGGTLPGDEPLLAAVQRASFPGARALAEAGYWIGLGAVVSLVGVLAAGALVARGDRRAAVLLLAAVGARALNPWLKVLLASPRPDATQARLLERADGMGFPSGHTLGAALVYGTIALLARPHLPPRWRGVLDTLVLLVVVVTAWSRVYRGAHWPSDVLGALLLAGAGLLALAHARQGRGTSHATSAPTGSADAGSS